MATTLFTAVAGLLGVWAGDPPAVVPPVPPNSAAVVSAPLPPASAPVPPVPAPLPQTPARAPGVDLALRTQPDPYGIPTGLYGLDMQLVTFRDGIEATARARRSSGRNVMLVAGVGLGIAALLFWRASSNADAVDAARARGDIVISDPSGTQYAWAAIEGLLALGFVGYGAALASTRADPAPLLQYSRETYGVPR